MLYAILSDIHGNKYALDAVAQDMERFSPDGIILLGDIIDYGMQSNEVTDYIRSNWQEKIICNIWGNHEKAILTGDFNGFSSERGVQCAKHTASLLSEKTVEYLNSELIHDGFLSLRCVTKKFLRSTVVWKTDTGRI